MPVRRPFPLVLLLTLAATLFAAAPALAGGTVSLDGPVLRFTGDTEEPSNVTIEDANGFLTVIENASRMTAGPGCTLDEEGYVAMCPDTGVERIEVALGELGSDVRILAALPSLLQGGPGDDVLVGGPAEDAIDGGAGQDILAGGLGADLLEGGIDDDLVTYSDRIGLAGTLLPRREAVRIAVGRPDYSGAVAADERDTIADDVEQVEGGASGDRFELRDGVLTAVACGSGRDRVIADPRDDVDVDCESTGVAPPPGGTPLTLPTLSFPFPKTLDVGRGEVVVEPVLPLLNGTVTVRVACPLGVGLLDIGGPGCSGKVRFLRGQVLMGTKRIAIARGAAKVLRLRLTGSRALARRPGGLAMTVVALPSRGDVQRVLRFTVRG